MANEFFEPRDLNAAWSIRTAEELWAIILRFKPSWLVGRAWTTGLKPGSHLFFRGQPNTEYGLSSKLYRDIRSAQRLAGGPSSAIDEPTLRSVEGELIEVMRKEGIGRRMTDGELLMVLQHHGIATRLVDVSDAPLEALFFAVDQQPDKDGRLFIVHPNAPSSSFGGEVNLGATQELPWASKSWGSKSAGDLTTTVAAVNDMAVDPRMRA